MHGPMNVKNIKLMYLYKNTSLLCDYKIDLTSQSQNPLGSILTSATIYNSSSCVEQVCGYVSDVEQSAGSALF